MKLKIKVASICVQIYMRACLLLLRIVECLDYYIPWMGQSDPVACCTLGKNYRLQVWPLVLDFS